MSPRAQWVPAFVAAQDPDGDWYVTAYGKPVCHSLGKDAAEIVVSALNQARSIEQELRSKAPKAATAPPAPPVDKVKRADGYFDIHAYGKVLYEGLDEEDATVAADAAGRALEAALEAGPWRPAPAQAPTMAPPPPKHPDVIDTEFEPEPHGDGPAIYAPGCGPGRNITRELSDVLAFVDALVEKRLRTFFADNGPKNDAIANQLSWEALRVAREHYFDAIDQNNRIEAEHDRQHEGGGVNRRLLLSDAMQLLAHRSDLSPAQAIAQVQEIYELSGFRPLPVGHHDHEPLKDPASHAIRGAMAFLDRWEPG